MMRKRTYTQAFGIPAAISAGYNLYRRFASRRAVRRAPAPLAMAYRSRAAGSRTRTMTKRRRKGKRSKKNYLARKRQKRFRRAVKKIVMQQYPKNKAFAECYRSIVSLVNRMETGFISAVGVNLSTNTPAASSEYFRLMPFAIPGFANNGLSDLFTAMKQSYGVDVNNISFQTQKIQILKCRCQMRMRNNMNLRVRIRLYTFRPRYDVTQDSDIGLSVYENQPQVRFYDPDTVFRRSDDDEAAQAISSGPKPEERSWKHTLHYYHNFASRFKILSVKTITLDPGASHVWNVRSPIEGRVISLDSINRVPISTRWTRYTAIDVMGDMVYDGSEFAFPSQVGPGPVKVDIAVNNFVQSRRVPQLAATHASIRRENVIDEPYAVPIDSNVAVAIGN